MSFRYLVVLWHLLLNLPLLGFGVRVSVYQPAQAIAQAD